VSKIVFSIIKLIEYNNSAGVVFSYEVQIRSIASISGVFMLTEMGTIYSYNENLFHELLGMEFESDEQNKLVN
jgi:hypothetical protein